MIYKNSGITKICISAICLTLIAGCGKKRDLKTVTTLKNPPLACLDNTLSTKDCVRVIEE